MLNWLLTHSLTRTLARLTLPHTYYLTIYLVSCDLVVSEQVSE
jgi:hypothetical protein